MRPCKAERPVTCPFGKKGSAWSTGEHGGIDYGTPSGDPVYAMWGGKITGNSWGSAYGTHLVIDHDVLPDGDPGLWAIYAHLKSKSVGSGDRVEAGDLIGYSDNTGNTSGAHLHVEVQPQSTWVKGSYRDPKRWVEAGGTSADDGPYKTADVYSSKMGYGEPSNGDASSDSIKELQERLNRISLEGGKTIGVTGVYDDATDAEVRKWQEQIAMDPPDPVGESYLGPAQFEAMFPDSIYTLHDSGLPAIASGAGTDDGGTSLGQWLVSQGFEVDDNNVPFGRDSSWHGVDFVLVHHTVSPDNGAESDIARYIREGGSGTYPPLAQIMLGQSGKVWMCSKQREGQAEPGRASQAGNGDGYGIPDDSMNAYSLGIECQADGTKPLSDYPVMYDVLIQLIAALVKRYDIPTTNIEEVIGHKEWSNTGKTDPRDSMDTIRADVERFLGGDVPPPTPGTVPPGDVYVSKLVKGQTDSDSVRRLQDVLNRTTVGSPGAATQGFTIVLEITGTYDDATDTTVRALQEFTGYEPTGYVTAEQALLFFEHTEHTVIDDTQVPPTLPPSTEVVTLAGGHCHDIQAAMDTAAAQGKTLRLTGTYAVYTNVYIPDDLSIDATGAKFFVNNEEKKEKGTYNSGRFKNASNNNAAGYGAAGWFVWKGGEFDGNGEGIFTISHSPGFTLKEISAYRYCSANNTGHAIETNSSGGDNDLGGPFNVQIVNNMWLGTDMGQRSNSNDEPVHFDWNWDGSGGAEPVWHKGDPKNSDTQTMCHNVLVKGNTFHRRAESGGWEYALCAIGGHDTSDTAFDPVNRHNHFLYEANTIHGAKGSTEVSPDKGAIHLCWLRDAEVKGNKLVGGVQNRFITSEGSTDAGYCEASGNTTSNPTLSNPDKIVVN